MSACVRTSWGWQGRQSGSEFPRLLGALEKLAVSSWPPAGALGAYSSFPPRFSHNTLRSNETVLKTPAVDSAIVSAPLLIIVAKSMHQR